MLFIKGYFYILVFAFNKVIFFYIFYIFIKKLIRVYLFSRIVYLKYFFVFNQNIKK